MKDAMILGAFTFVVGIVVGVGMAPEGTRTVVDNEVVKITTPTTTEPVLYQDVLCNSEDEIAVVITENAYDHQIGERFCVHVDTLVSREG